MTCGLSEKILKDNAVVWQFHATALSLHRYLLKQ